MRKLRSFLVLTLVVVFMFSISAPVLAADGDGIIIDNGGFDFSEPDPDPGTDPDPDPGTDPDPDPGTDPDPKPDTGDSNTSSSVKYYDITVEETENGVAEANRRFSESGRKITVTVESAEGYEVDTLVVYRASDAEELVEVLYEGDGKYTFTMPAFDVIVVAQFAKTESIPEPLPFIDVDEDDWYYDAVKYVYENGLMTGTSDTTFSPMMTTTRAMVVTILWRLEDSPVVNYVMTFEDVDPEAWYGEAVRWASSEGIVSGYSEKEFGPNDTVTREQFATILFRYAAYKGYDTSSRADLSRYTDVGEVHDWALEAMQWANAENLITGSSAVTLSPRSAATRAEIATILMRFCEDIVQ